MLASLSACTAKYRLIIKASHCIKMQWLAFIAVCYHYNKKLLQNLFLQQLFAYMIDVKGIFNSLQRVYILILS